MKMAKSIWITILFGVTPVVGAATCEELSSRLTHGDTKILLAKLVTAGGLASQTGNPIFSRLPGFCQVQAEIRSTPSSRIGIEVWMPEAGWNGRLVGVGGGGWGGVISRNGLAIHLAQGYAAVSTDTGHTIQGAAFALGPPDELIDYSYRAVHEMTVKAKAFIAAYYGVPPKYSYFIGCSLGGQQGLKESQMYPADYDGIVAGCSTYNRTHLHAWQLYMGLQSLKGEHAMSLPKEKLATLENAVLATCDAVDGVKDGILSDPLRCRFDPNTLLCPAGDSTSCLTVPQVEMVRLMYSRLSDPTSGKPIFPGVSKGGESAWILTANGAQPYSLAVNMFRFLVHRNPDWDWRAFDLGRDTALADRLHHTSLNADQDDLSGFRLRGGKLLMWHGWIDPAVPAQSSIDYYERVVAKGGAKTAEFVRLFMAPGVSHCGGGFGPNQFNMLAALERWVESGRAPEQILASRVNDGRVDMTRPLCPYPQVAQYLGEGTTTDASNFACRPPNAR